MIRSIHGPILHHFRDKRFQSKKKQNFPIPRIYRPADGLSQNLATSVKFKKLKAPLRGYPWYFVTAAGLKNKKMTLLPDVDDWYSHFDIVSTFYGRSVRRDRNGKSRSRCQSDKMSYQHCRIILTSDKTSCARGDTICPRPLQVLP